MLFKVVKYYKYYYINIIAKKLYSIKLVLSLFKDRVVFYKK